MLDKQEIIDLAFLKLGEHNNLYHTNITDRLKIASLLFDEVIKELATDATFMFNSRTIRLNKNLHETNYRGEYRYNKPNDYLTRVWCSDRHARIESEYIYSKEDNLELCYCYTMPLNDYPMYLRKLIIPKLAKKLAETYDGYYQKIPLLQTEIMDETNKILITEGIPFQIER